QGELEHRRVKRFYARTNKIKFARGIAKQQRRERLLYKLRQKAQDAAQQASDYARETDSHPTVNFCERELLPQCSPESQYQISNSRRLHWDITAWLHRNREDFAIKDFLPRLKDHILARLLGSNDHNEQTFTPAQRNSLIIVDNKIYRHKVLRINYTTYDLRRAQDSLNPRMHADIMVLANEESQPGELAPHPYWYARIVGIFHVYVRYLGAQSHSRTSQRIDFLWVRWFCRDSNHKSGWAARRLHRIGFFDANEVGAEAFGFVDPHQVIRGVHLIPAYAHGFTYNLLPPSIARQPRDLDADFNWYYINQYVFFLQKHCLLTML
ncbi:hypothetical protein M405DRAFT_732338, partial [Rhizopogon salebrosus TDB-379]